jgi:hypothetical protein
MPEEAIIARCKAAAGNLDLAQPGPKRSVVAWNVRVADEIPNQSTAEFISAAFDGMGVLVEEVERRQSTRPEVACPKCRGVFTTATCLQCGTPHEKGRLLMLAYFDSVAEVDRLGSILSGDVDAMIHLGAENTRLVWELATRTQERDKVYDELIAEAVQFKDEIRTLSETVTAQKSHIAELREHNIELAREVLRANAKKPKPKQPAKRKAKKGAKK